MSTGEKRPRTMSSDDAMLQSKIPRTESGDGSRQNMNRAKPSFSTIGISGNATVLNLNGNVTMQQTASTDGMDRHMLHDTNTRMKSVQHGLDKSEVMKWIYTADSDTSLSYNAAQKVHLPGTGSWFLDGSEFLKWKEQLGSVLWLYGGPGCGKTILSCGYAAIANVIGFCDLKPLLRGYAYFFFDARNDKLQLLAHEKFIRSLITQLSDRCGDELPSALVSMYRACDSGRRAPSLISLEETLLQVLECFEDVYIVIDSLDECAENSKSDLLHWIKSVTSKASGKLHLMASSRPEQQVMQGLASLEASCLQRILFIESAMKGDIGALIDAEVAKMAKWKNVERQRIKAIILPRSGGMFRWVALQLHDVRKCSSKKDLYEQLESLPQGLDETYARIFKRSKNPDVLLKLLQWLAFSQREMTLNEIAEVAAVDLRRAEGPIYDRNMRYEDAAEVLNICYGLVTEVEGFIKLAHFSVKEHLIQRIQPAPGRTSAQLSHSVIAQTCLAQLLYFDKSSIVSWSRNIQRSRCRINSSFPLSEYAAVYWISHYHSASTEATDDPRLLNLLKGLFTLPHSYALNSWALLRGHNHLPYRAHLREMSLKEITSPLHYACAAGLTELVGHLIETGAEINEVGQSSTPLLEAIEKGHLNIVKLLLEHGADVSIAGGKALQEAYEWGHLEIVKLLLEHGADASVEGGQVLQDASHAGHLEIVKLLLEHGPDVGVAGGKALRVASRSGHLDIVMLLLEHGVDVSVAGGKALWAASGRGHLEIAMLLLEHGADANVEGGQALQDASHAGHLEIVKLLLEHVTDVIVTGGNALWAVSECGHLEIIKLLLEHGADVNVEDGQPLQIASYTGRLEIVKLLLERGADVSVAGGKPLQEASKWGHLEIAMLLLEHGADVSAAGGKALQMASKRGHLEIVKLLLEHGVDVNFNGADVDADSDCPGTALHIATTQGHLEIAQLLQERGARSEGLRATWRGQRIIFNTSAYQVSR